MTKQEEIRELGGDMLRVKDAEIGKHLSLVCPQCKHMHKQFILWQATRLNYHCSMCGTSLYWEQTNGN